METNWASILREARGCHTKAAWQKFLCAYSEELANTNMSKPLLEIFKMLKDDPQAKQYSPMLWAAIMEGCLSSWDLNLGQKVAAFTATIPAAVTAVPAAKISMESGRPAQARKLALRATRLTQLSTEIRLQLDMIVARSYVEEGKRALAVRMLNKMEETVNDAQLPEPERAQFLMNMARISFFLGRYQQAGQLFHSSFEIYRSVENWEQSARAVYNAGSSLFNAGGKSQEEAFRLVEECRKISETHRLYGPLSFVESFYGHDDYWHGNFAGARDHYRRAHKYLPTQDGSFRTLHVTSMLALIYLRTGQYKLAKKFGDKTLELAAKDESNRFVSRYHNLQAELIWESGDIEASQEFLRDHCQLLLIKGVNTLEELSTLSRYYLQCARLGEAPISISYKISEQLKKNTGEWIEYKYAQGLLHLAQNQIASSRLAFEACLNRAKHYGDRLHHALGLLGLIQIQLKTGGDVQKIGEQLSELEIILGRMVENPLKAHAYIVYAALAYRRGDFQEAVEQLKTAAALPRLNFTDRFTLNSWIASAEGRSPRLKQDWQEKVLGQMTTIYFAPSLTVETNRHYRISNHYLVDLSRYPALADFMDYLLQKNHFTASPEEIQVKVWKQSLTSQGWQQKIRNNIMRLRDLFPFTMAPLIIHAEEVRLNTSAVSITPKQRHSENTRAEILRLLQDGPLSSTQLANRVKVSPATTKRVLKKLSEDQHITTMKIGRKVLYQALNGDATLNLGTRP